MILMLCLSGAAGALDRDLDNDGYWDFGQEAPTAISTTMAVGISVLVARIATSITTGAGITTKVALTAAWIMMGVGISMPAVQTGISTTTSLGL